MESKIVPNSSILFTFVILIQQATAPTQPAAEISMDELQKTLLKDAASLEEVETVIKLAKDNPEEAKKRIQSYKRGQYTKEVLWLLGVIAHTPEQMYTIVRPIFVKIDEVLKKKSTTYREFSVPLWRFLKNLSYGFMKCVGFTMRAGADVTQIVNDVLRELSTAYHGETPNPVAFNTVDNIAEKVKLRGDGLEKAGKVGLDEASRLRRIRAGEVSQNGEAKIK